MKKNFLMISGRNVSQKRKEKQFQKHIYVHSHFMLLLIIKNKQVAIVKRREMN